MKKTSQKLLLLLYPSHSNRVVSLPIDRLGWLLPELSAEGQRSLLYLLEEKQLILTERIESETWLRLTAHGAAALAARFPALNPQTEGWTGEWLLVVFQHPPKGDPAFRALRAHLLKHWAVAITRGTYLVPSVFSQPVISELESRYRGHVVVLQVGSWVFGSEQPIVSRAWNLIDIISAYSSISKENDRLLAKLRVKKTLIGRDKTSLHNTYNRFMLVVADDPGLGSYYYPGKTRGREVLASFQTLLLTESQLSE